MYKKGDKVRIKTGLKVDKGYGKYEVNFISEMKKYEGKIATIVSRSRFYNIYMLDIDDNYFSWAKEMLEDVVPVPEKWCVKCTPENHDDLNVWFFEKTGEHRIDLTSDSYWHYPLFNQHGLDLCCTSAKIKKGYTLISFEQFKENIMNDKLEFPKKMYVWDNKDEYIDDNIQNVIAYIKGEEFPYIIKSDEGFEDRFIGYKHAKDVEEVKKVTLSLKDISKKFEIPLNQLRIKD